MRQANYYFLTFLFILFLFSPQIGQGESISKNQDDESPSDRQDVVKEAKIFARFTNEMSNKYRDLFNLLNYVDAINALSRGVFFKEITKEYAVRQYRKAVTDFEINYKNEKDYIKNLRRPTFTFPLYEGLSKNIYNYINTLLPQINLSMKEEKKLFEASLSGDLESINMLDIRSRKTFIVMLNGENHMMELQKAQYGEDVPAYYLYDAIIYTNNSMANLIKAKIKEIEGSILTHDQINAFLNIAKSELDSSRKAISKGILSIDEWIEANRKVFVGQKNGKAFLEKIRVSFERSFEIEGQIVKMMDIVLDNFSSEETIEQFEILLRPLVNERMKEANKRTMMTSKFLQSMN